jgi:hypothetical protein
MTTPESTADDPLMRVLQQHLEQQESSLNVDTLHSRILADSCTGKRHEDDGKSSGATAGAKRLWPAWTVGASSVVIAASLLLGFVLMPSAELRAEQAVREAEAALRLPVERCYLVEVRPGDGDAPEEALPTRTMRVWAAADKFRVEMTRGNFRWAWGRDADGTVWLTSNPQRGVGIAPDEQGPALVWSCELFGLRPESLLSHIAAHFRVKEDSRPGSNYPRVIRAEPRPTARQTRLQSAVLELDPETKAIRCLTLNRQNRDGVGTSTVKFTLIDTRPVEDARYRLEGNLSEPFQVFDREFEPDRRREILSRWVGPNVDTWLRPAPKK